MENAIATMKFNVPTTYSFKNPELNEATAKIANILSNVGSIVLNADVEMCKVLSHISTTKCYVDDGFASVAEYAESTFGLGKSNAHAKARAGTNFYNNPEMADVVAALPVEISNAPSKIVELLDCNKEDILAAIETGEINADSTQKELRKWGDDHAVPTSKRGARRERAESGISPVLPTLKIFAKYGDRESNYSTNDIPDSVESVGKYVHDALNGGESPYIIKSLPTWEDDDGKKTIKRGVMVDDNGNAVYFQYRRVAAEKKSTPKTHELSEADIIRMYNEMCARKQAEGRQ